MTTSSFGIVHLHGVSTKLGEVHSGLEVNQLEQLREETMAGNSAMLSYVAKQNNAHQQHQNLEQHWLDSDVQDPDLQPTWEAERQAMERLPSQAGLRCTPDRDSRMKMGR